MSRTKEEEILEVFMRQVLDDHVKMGRSVEAALAAVKPIREELRKLRQERHTTEKQTKKPKGGQL